MLPTPENFCARIAVAGEQSQLLQSKKVVKLVPAHYLISMQKQKLKFCKFLEGVVIWKEMDVVVAEVGLP